MQIYDTVFGNFSGYFIVIAAAMLFELISDLRKEKKKNRTFKDWGYLKKIKLGLKMGIITFLLAGSIIYIYVFSEEGSIWNQWRKPLINIVCSVIPILFTSLLIFYLHKNTGKNPQTGFNTRYVIKSDTVLFIFFIIATILIGGFMIYTIIVKSPLWVILGYGIFLFISVIGIFNCGLWKIEVNDDQIIYRSTFGLVRKYDFRDITKGIFKKSGAFRVYIGEKRIFTFDNNMDFKNFILHMERMRIPIWQYEAYKKKRKT